MSQRTTLSDWTDVETPSQPAAGTDCDHLPEYNIAGECLRCNDPTPESPGDELGDAVRGRSSGQEVRR